MVRNLLDQDFEPYAALVMALELEEVFQSLYHIGGLRAPSLTVDGVPLMVSGHNEHLPIIYSCPFPKIAQRCNLVFQIEYISGKIGRAHV